MTDGNLNQTILHMQHHGMKTPQQGVRIHIPQAAALLHEVFTYILSLQEKQLVWCAEYDRIASWLTDNQGRGLFMCGDCGRGKSLLGRYIIPAILLKHCRKVVSVYDTQEMNARLDEVLSKHIISLDDIGTEEVVNNYGNKREAFAEIIDSAEKYGKLLIVNTNLGKEGIITRYGERVYDRIIATTCRVEFKGASLRR